MLGLLKTTLVETLPAQLLATSEEFVITGVGFFVSLMPSSSLDFMPNSQHVGPHDLDAAHLGNPLNFRHIPRRRNLGMPEEEVTASKVLRTWSLAHV